MHGYLQMKYLDLHEIKYERLAEQMRKNSAVLAEHQAVDSYEV